MSVLLTHQTPSSTYNNKQYQEEYKDGRYITIFGDKAYKFTNALDDIASKLAKNLLFSQPPTPPSYQN
jgi:hypothetical protein